MQPSMLTQQRNIVYIFKKMKVKEKTYLLSTFEDFGEQRCVLRSRQALCGSRTFARQRSNHFESLQLCTCNKKKKQTIVSWAKKWKWKWKWKIACNNYTLLIAQCIECQCTEQSVDRATLNQLLGSCARSRRTKIESLYQFAIGRL